MIEHVVPSVRVIVMTVGTAAPDPVLTVPVITTFALICTLPSGMSVMGRLDVGAAGPAGPAGPGGPAGPCGPGGPCGPAGPTIQTVPADVVTDAAHWPHAGRETSARKIKCFIVQTQRLRRCCRRCCLSRAGSAQCWYMVRCQRTTYLGIPLLSMRPQPQLCY